MADVIVNIESLDNEGRGIARADGKAVFVEGALPGERVAIATLKRKPTYEIARATRVLSASASRVAPRCPHFGTCGGCSLQHAVPVLQVAAKQRVLEEALARLGRVAPERLLPPVYGPSWGYRYRARLSVRNVPKKGGVLVGFHERKSSYVADMQECHVLPRRISDLLPRLRRLVEGLSIRDRVPQIEVAVGERPPDGRESRQPEPVHALVFRILEPLGPDDGARLRAFAEEHAVDIWLQTGGPATAAPFHPPRAPLAYSLPEFGVFVPFGPTEFTQVNHAVNGVLVRRGDGAARPAHRGNASPTSSAGWATSRCRSPASARPSSASRAPTCWWTRARENAAANGLTERTRFAAANLFEATHESIEAFLPLDKALIDPPREGAIELAKALPHRDDERSLQRIVYVSCNPATLARDAAVLVHERGYTLDAAGVVNMFPHTAHVESIALFVR